MYANLKPNKKLDSTKASWVPYATKDIVVTIHNQPKISVHYCAQDIKNRNKYMNKGPDNLISTVMLNGLKP